MAFADWEDPSVIEAASWRLASELVRRHPATTRLNLLHPGGGMYDCLSVRSASGDAGGINLNRNGRIHINGRFDGREVLWEPAEWDDYLRAEPRGFLRRVETAAGLQAPSQVPAATATTVTLRVLAALVATTVKAPDPIRITSGFFDTSGYGGGPHLEAFAHFPHLAARRQDPTDDPEELGEYRYWFAEVRSGAFLAFNQSTGRAWRAGIDGTIQLLPLYVASGRNVAVAAAKLLDTSPAA